MQPARPALGSATANQCTADDFWHWLTGVDARQIAIAATKFILVPPFREDSMSSKAQIETQVFEPDIPHFSYAV